MKKRWAAFVLFCLAALAAASAAAQALWVRRADGVGESVQLWLRSEEQAYLFLPAYMDAQTLSVKYEGYDALFLGDMRLKSGVKTDALQNGMTLALVKGNTRVSVQVMVGALPAVHLTTQSGSLDYIHEKKGNKEPGSVVIVDGDGGVDFSGPLAQIKGHGNATFVYEKKSYQIKLEKKGELLGMDEGKTFVLLANQHENSLLRNRITFDLAESMGLPFTPESRSVDLYVNGEYRGCYLLCDKVNVSDGSVDVTDMEKELEALNDAFLARGGEPEAYGEQDYKKSTHKGAVWPKEPEDVTGGYLFQLEYPQRYDEEDSGVVTARGQAVVVKSPERMTQAQGEYAAAMLNRFERAIFAEDGVDARSGEHYTEIADFDSWVRKYMIEEISKNYDGNKSSQYFFKDSDSEDALLYAGPVWDYDSAWGNYARADKLEAASPEGLSIAKEGYGYSWWPALVKQEDFAAEVSRVYTEELRPLLQVLIGEASAPEGASVKSLNEYARELDASAQMNFKRWRVLNHSTRAIQTGATYDENIEYLTSWIRLRMQALDESW